MWERQNNLPNARLKGARFVDAASLGAGLACLLAILHELYIYIYIPILYAQVEMFGYIEKLKPLLTLTKSSPVHIPVWSLKRSTYAIIFVYIYSYPHPVYCWQPLVYIALVLPVDEE